MDAAGSVRRAREEQAGGVRDAEKRWSEGDGAETAGMTSEKRAPRSGAAPPPWAEAPERGRVAVR